MESSIAAQGRQRSTVELSCEGDLSRAMWSGTITADALAHSARMCLGRPERAYCCTVEHSWLVAERFVEAGWRAAHVDGDTPAGHRLAAVEALARGELDVLTNCYLFTEAVDSLPLARSFCFGQRNLLRSICKGSVAPCVPSRARKRR